MIAQTHKTPEWVHFGAGNIFRIFPAALAQQLLEIGLSQTGIIVVEGYDGEIIDKIFHPYDNLSLAVTLKANGTIEKKIIASVASALRLDVPEQFNSLCAVFRAPSLKMVSFTITEKGYALTDRSGALLPTIAADFKQGPESPHSYLGQVSRLVLERYRAGALPLALVSLDNCSHNGDKLFAAVEAFAIHWCDGGFVETAFLEYVVNKAQLSFPWTMIDKITPRPDESVKEMLLDVDFTDVEATITNKNTYIAPFVNAEEAQYLVIEDFFPAGRPALEKVGVYFTDRATVDRVEKMKVCTCLNPLHTALAIFGCLLGYTKISDEMKNPLLVKLIEKIGYTEGLPVVTDPGIISPKAFIDEVLQVRLPNPFMPDTPQRIACDSSLKIPIRFGETIKAYKANQNLNTADLHAIPLVIAGWLRYLLGVDDQGAAFTVSPDPQYEGLAASLAGIHLGDTGPFHAVLEPILKDIHFFAIDLYEAGLAERIEQYFAELVSGPGAVAQVLQKVAVGE
jgi:fructuronate reductase